MFEPLAPAEAQGDISPKDMEMYSQLFRSLKPHDGYVLGREVHKHFVKSKISPPELTRIWAIVDRDADHRVNEAEFSVMMQLIRLRLGGADVPSFLPPALQSVLNRATTQKSSAPYVPPRKTRSREGGLGAGAPAWGDSAPASASADDHFDAFFGPQPTGTAPSSAGAASFAAFPPSSLGSSAPAAAGKQAAASSSESAGAGKGKAAGGGWVAVFDPFSSNGASSSSSSSASSSFFPFGPPPSQPVTPPPASLSASSSPAMQRKAASVASSSLSHPFSSSGPSASAGGGGAAAGPFSSVAPSASVPAASLPFPSSPSTPGKAPGSPSIARAPAPSPFKVPTPFEGVVVASLRTKAGDSLVVYDPIACVFRRPMQRSTPWPGGKFEVYRNYRFTATGRAYVGDYPLLHEAVEVESEVTPGLLFDKQTLMNTMRPRLQPAYDKTKFPRIVVAGSPTFPTASICFHQPSAGASGEGKYRLHQVERPDGKLQQRIVLGDQDIPVVAEDVLPDADLVVLGYLRAVSKTDAQPKCLLTCLGFLSARPPPAPAKKESEEVTLLLAQRESLAQKVQRLTQECMASRAEVAAMRADLVRKQQEIEDLGATRETRKARASSLAANGNPLVQLSAERLELKKRIQAVASECSSVSREVQNAKDALIALAADDDMSVGSWLAPSVAPDVSPPHSPSSSVRTSACPSPNMNRSRGPQLYTTLYPYVGQSEDELSFAAGETIELVPEESGEEGWLKGRKDGSVGIFPANYVRRMTESEASQARGGADAMLEDEESGGGQVANLRAVTIFSWKGRKENQLSFPKNAIITVRKQGESWWAGELDGKVGWFPRSFVKLIRNEAVPAAQAAPLETQTTTSSTTNTAPKVAKPFKAVFSYEGVEKGELSFNANDIIMVVKQEGEWWEGHCNGRSGQFPRKYVKPCS